MKLVHALCPLVLILLACSASNASVLQDACKSWAAQNPRIGYDYCIKFFQVDAGSAGADKRGLATIAVKIIGEAARSTAHHIAALQASEKDKKRLAGLKDCSEVYSNALDQIGPVLQHIALGTPEGRQVALILISGMAEAPKTCEQGFDELGVRPSPLAAENDDYSNKASIATAVTAAL